MKKGVVVLLVLVLLVSVVNSISLVSAGWFADTWNKIAGKVTENETEAPNETETEEAPNETETEVEEEVEPETAPEPEPEPEPEPQPEKQCEKGEVKKYECPDGTEVPECGCENGMWVCKIFPENDCPEEEEPETCAASIKITFNKKVYSVGDHVKIVIEIFDSQGNLIPNHAFYAKMYDDRWHTPDLQRTGADGYFTHTDTAKRGSGGFRFTKIKFKVYTKETASCNSVEDTTEVSLEEEEPVSCGIGTCIPDEEDEKEEDGKEEKIFYACSGCELGEKCYPMGYRKEGQYCSEDYEFVGQSEDDSFCENSFECKTNLCIDGECMSSNLWRKIINFFRKIFGPEPPGKPTICSKLLIEKNLGDYDYLDSEYGERKEQQAAVYSEDGTYLETIKCCMAGYSHKETGKEKAALVCPYDNREDVENSLHWILINEQDLSLVDSEYKGHKIYGDMDVAIVWTNKAYLVACGGDPRVGTPVAEDLADAYFKKYPSDL